MNFLKNKLKGFNFGAWVDLNVTNLGFIGASIVSALINISFIGNLTKDEISLGLFVVRGVVLMTAISLVLEMAKLLHVTKVNTLGELQRKLKGTSAEQKIKGVKTKWFFGYLFYTLIAVAAAVNFSIGNLGREAKKVDSEIATLEAQYNESQRIEREILDLKKQIESLETTLDDETEVNTLWLEYNEINKLRSTAFGIAAETEVKVESVKEYKEFQSRAIDFCNNLGITQTIGKHFTTLFNKSSLAEELNKRVLKRKTKFETDLQNKEDELKSTLQQYSNSYKVGLKLEEIKAKKIAEAGSQAGLEIFSNMLGISSDIFKTIFILMLSLAVELTIFQCAPTIKITRKMLYRFIRYLPVDFDVNSFMDKIEKEMVEFSVLDITNKDQFELTREEIEIEKAKRRVEKKSLEKEEKNLTEEINKTPLIVGEEEKNISVRENKGYKFYKHFKDWQEKTGSDAVLEEVESTVSTHPTVSDISSVSVPFEFSPKEEISQIKPAPPLPEEQKEIKKEEVQYTPEGFVVGVKKPKKDKIEKKKRGRPPKNRENQEDLSFKSLKVENTEIDQQNKEIEMEKQSKRRGRPPKNKTQGIEQKTEVEKFETKKRGRPPKYTEEQRKEIEKQRRENAALTKQAENLAAASASVSNTYTDSYPKQELKNYEEEAKKFETSPPPTSDKPFIEEDPKAIKVYAFGRTTKEVASKMEELLEEVYSTAKKNGNNNLILDFEALKKETNLKPRAFEILWSSLTDVPGFLNSIGDSKYQLTRYNLQEAKNMVLQEKVV